MILLYETNSVVKGNYAIIIITISVKKVSTVKTVQGITILCIYTARQSDPEKNEIVSLTHSS